MNETYQALLKFLDSNGMTKASRALKEELGSNSKEYNKRDKDSYKNIIKVINNAIIEKSQKEQRQNQREEYQTQQLQQQQKKATPALYSQEETEAIMEKLMNRLVGSPNLLEDEKLNAKIEKFFDNQTFQKMVECTDVFQDISNLSFTNSIVQKNKLEQMNKTDHTSNSWEAEGVPKFGGQSNIMLEDSENKQYVTPDKNQPQKPDKRPPSMDELFITEEDQPKTDQKDQKQKKKSDQKHQIQGKTEQQFDLSDNGKMPSIIKAEGNNESSDFLRDSQSIILDQIEDPKDAVDEYIDDDDPGFELYEVAEKDFSKFSKQLADKYGFPQRATLPSQKKDEKNDKNKENPKTFSNEEDSAVLLKDLQEGKNSKKEKNDDATDSGVQAQPSNEEKKSIDKDHTGKKKPKGYIYLPEYVKHPQSNDEFYPVEYDKVIYDCFSLKVIFDRERTGFEETKDFPIVINSIIAGRYQIIEYLGAAAFSKAIQCLDLVTNKMLCMKIIENNKDYYDQSIDEIKLLKYINYNGDPDEKNVLRLYDYFYHKEHLFIITELLKDNLYEFYKYNRENEPTPYFTVGRLQKITMQILIGLEYIHNLRLIHCDLKPENILMKSYSRCEVKIIDFGSSCFIHDHLSSYVQSRSYRAPEVIIGCKYDYKIDMWSLGCILAELWTGNVLFQNDSVQGLLSRVIGIVGPFPEWMFKEGRLVYNFFTKEKLLYQEVYEDGEQSQNFNETSDAMNKKRNKTGKIQILVPKRSNLKARLRSDDQQFLDFVKQLLTVDYTKRPSAKEAMSHPWFQQKYSDGL